MGNATNRQREGIEQAATICSMVENNRIVPDEIYEHLAQTAFNDWAGNQVCLAMGASSLWNEFVIVRLAVIYRGRALPISRVVLKQKSTMVAFVNYKQILKEAAIRCPKTVMPTGWQIVVLAIISCFVQRVIWAGVFASCPETG